MANNKKLKIGIIGCGTIGFQLAEAIEKRFSHQARLFALCDSNTGMAESLRAISLSKPKILSIDELIKESDLVVESAKAEIAYEIAHKSIKAGKDIMLMSVGGILAYADELFSLARDRQCHIYLPSGAIAGLDAVKAAGIAKIEKATLVTRKPLEGLRDAPYLAKKRIDLSKITKETVIFEGRAADAVGAFPKNINVCAALSLAGIGAEKTTVKIVTSPEYTANSHEIELEGDFGILLTRTVNIPSPTNPKTSYLASLSAIATLKNILDVVKIGT